MEPLEPREYVCLAMKPGRLPFMCQREPGHEGMHGAVRFEDGTYKYEWSDGG